MREKIKLVSSAGTGYFYTTSKNKKLSTEKLRMKKYDPKVRKHVDGLDGVVHSIGFAPQSCLGGGFLDAPWDDVATALHVSTYSYKSLAMAALPLVDGLLDVGVMYVPRTTPGVKVPLPSQSPTTGTSPGLP